MMGNYEYSREATKITLDKVSSWEELNTATLQKADDKFKEATKKYWKEFAVSGVLQFDQKEGKQILKPFTDLDGRSAIAILEKAGINTSNLTYVKPGEFLKGAINLDTGDKFGVVYEEPTYTAYFDHHAKNTEVTSTTEIMYKTMVDLGMVEKSPEMDRLVKFVNDIDNRKLPPEEFLKSGKTIIGVQRDVDFKKLLTYFTDHESPTDILTPEEFEKYGLRESAERQQKTVDESMAKLAEMEKKGKVINTQYGQVVVNENNELRTGSSAAYVKYDGIINFSPDKSFAVTLKDKDLDEQALRQKLGDKFQGKIIRGKMWIYNDSEPLGLTKEEIIRAISRSQESLADKLEKLPIELLPEKSSYTIAELKEIIPNNPIVVCDFYIDGIEKGEEFEFGYRQEGVTSIDHHAPGNLMARQISSTNLAIQFVEKNGAIMPPVHVVVNHTDCDSILSSSIMMGILGPDQKFGEAAIAADHTGAPNEIADLLQSIEKKRGISFSLSNLEKLLAGKPIDKEAKQMLDKRLENRNGARRIVEDGKFKRVGNVYFSSVSDKFDAGMLPALLPDAVAIVIGSPMKDNPDMWEIKVRLGMKAPEGLTLNTLDLPDFGGRWNAGDTKRKGGTKLNPEEYATALNTIIQERLSKVILKN